MNRLDVLKSMMSRTSNLSRVPDMVEELGYAPQQAAAPIVAAPPMAAPVNPQEVLQQPPPMEAPVMDPGMFRMLLNALAARRKAAPPKTILGATRG